MTSPARPSPTLLLSPHPLGCGWLPDASKDVVPRCQEPPTYVLTCTFTGARTQACVEHTAAMRALHPDWIAQVGSLPKGQEHLHDLADGCRPTCPAPSDQDREGRGPDSRVPERGRGSETAQTPGRVADHGSAPPFAHQNHHSAGAS